MTIDEALKQEEADLDAVHRELNRITQMYQRDVGRLKTEALKKEGAIEVLKTLQTEQTQEKTA